MWYLILGHDAPDTLPQRLAARGRQLAPLPPLRHPDRRPRAGPEPPASRPPNLLERCSGARHRTTTRSHRRSLPAAP